jgi:hypothetical protein
MPPLEHDGNINLNHRHPAPVKGQSSFRERLRASVDFPLPLVPMTLIFISLTRLAPAPNCAHENCELRE